MKQSVVLVEKQNGLATVTLNRPESLNAFNSEMRSTFCQVMLDLRADKEVGAIIVTGAGRAFSAGMDLKEAAAPGLREAGGVTFITVLDDMAVPVIAAVNGYAITGGFELALACDMIVAAENAQFADTHARVGVLPGGGISARLSRAVGIRKAKELSLTGNYLSAREAERLGLVNRVVPKQQLMAAAKELAGQILSCDQAIVREMKRVIGLAAETTLGDGLRLEREVFRAFNQSGRRDLRRNREAVLARGRAQVRQGAGS